MTDQEIVTAFVEWWRAKADTYAETHSESLIIRCSDCGRVALRIQAGVFSVSHRHDGETHSTRITLRRILDRLQAAGVR